MEDHSVRQERNGISTKLSGAANSKGLNGHSTYGLKDTPPVQNHPRLASSDSGGESSTSVSQEEVEKLRQMVKKLERQNRYLMKQQKQLIQQQKQLILPPQDASICSSVTQDDMDRMSLLSHSTIVASIHAGTTNDDTSSILTSSDYHIHHKGSQPPVPTNVAPATPVQSQRESRSSHSRKQGLPSSTKHSASVKTLTDVDGVHGKYAEDSWLYRVPKKASNEDTSSVTIHSATVSAQTSKNCTDSPSKSVTEKGSSIQNTTLSSVQWLREVFDSPQSLYMNSPARDWLLQKLDELRLTGRVSRWSSVSALPYMQTLQPQYSPSPVMTTPNNPRSHLMFDYHSNMSPSQTATFSRPVIKSTSFMPPRNSVGSLGSLVNPFNSTQSAPRIRENSPSTPIDGTLAASSSHRKETLMAAMNNIAMNDVLAMARRQEEHLKAQAHAVIQQQRNSRSRSRPAQEERQLLPSQPVVNDRLFMENSQNSLPRNYQTVSSTLK